MLVERLGAGGVGEVWKARDKVLNRVVALKFLAAPREESSTLQDLLREARAASALNHPNIITIFEVGEREGATYLAMEFVEGDTLRDRLRQGRVPLHEAVDIASQIVPPSLQQAVPSTPRALTDVVGPSGDIGFSAAEERCMKAIGPSAGSPTGAPASVRVRPFASGWRHTAAACIRTSCGC